VKHWLILKTFDMQH